MNNIIQYSRSTDPILLEMEPLDEKNISLISNNNDDELENDIFLGCVDLASSLRNLTSNIYRECCADYEEE